MRGGQRLTEGVDYAADGKERSSVVTSGLRASLSSFICFSTLVDFTRRGSLVIICSSQTGSVRSPAIQAKALPLALACTYADMFPARQQVKARHFITCLIWSFIKTQRGHKQPPTHVYVCRDCARGSVHILISFSRFCTLQIASLVVGSHAYMCIYIYICIKSARITEN